MSSGIDDIDDGPSTGVTAPDLTLAETTNAQRRSANALDRARPGDLTFGWRVMVGIAWFGVFLAYAAVWQASVQIGIATWWIGPRAQPNPAVVRILPFALALAIALFAIYNTPKLAQASIGASLLAAAIAIPDFSRSTGLALAELAIAGLIMIVSVTALSGRYRLAPAPAMTDCWPPPTPAP